VVLFNPVLEPAATAVLDEVPLAFALHGSQRPRVAVEPVGHDPRVRDVLAPEGLVGEAAGRHLTALGTEPEATGLAQAIDGSVEIAPIAIGRDKSLVGVPRPTTGPQVAAYPLLQLRSRATSSG